jgi:hypothetical protein
MGNLLLHNPWVQFYVLNVGVLGIALIYDFLRPRWPLRQPPAGPTSPGNSRADTAE